MPQRKNINKFAPFLFTGILLLLSTITILTKCLGDLDEIWNYTFSRGIAMGYKPYIDYPLVQMPAYALIMSIPLFISRTLISYRVFEILLLTTFSLTCHLLVSKITEKFYKYLIPVITVLVVGGNMTYNFGMLFMVLLLVYIHINGKPNTKTYFLIGVIAFMSIMFRQTSGSILAIFEIIYMLITTKESHFKKIFFYLLGGSIPCFLLLAYLLYNKSFFEFWDNCFFSLFTFGQSNGHLWINAVIVGKILLILFSVVLCITYFKKTKNPLYIYLLVVTLIVFSISLPILDTVHISYATAFCLITIVYCIGNYEPPFSKVFQVTLIAIFALAIVVYGAINLAGKDIIDHGELNHIPTDVTLEMYEEINAYNHIFNEAGFPTDIISESKVIFYIADGTFSGPDNFCNMENPVDYLMDLPKNTVIVISETYLSDNWQNSAPIYDYIITNYKKIDSYYGYGYYLKTT
ncbi:MAG: hypothetical protein MJ093_03660 [Saccharofermentans sp.]|nr:hypothetical protein [Saccharofermentans sp.]